MLCVNARIYFNVLVKCSHITILVLFQWSQFAFIRQIQRFLHGTGTGVTRPKNYYIVFIVLAHFLSPDARVSQLLCRRPGTSGKLNAAVAKTAQHRTECTESVIFLLFDRNKNKKKTKTISNKVAKMTKIYYNIMI